MSHGRYLLFDWPAARVQSARAFLCRSTRRAGHLHRRVTRQPGHAIFHVCQLGSKAVDQVRRDEYNQHRRSASGEGKWIKGTRYSLLKDTANQTAGQPLKLAEVVLSNKRMYRAFLLYGELRYIYRLPKPEAAERLDAWLARASRSRVKDTSQRTTSSPREYSDRNLTDPPSLTLRVGHRARSVGHPPVVPDTLRECRASQHRLPTQATQPQGRGRWPRR